MREEIIEYAKTVTKKNASYGNRESRKNRRRIRIYYKNGNGKR